VKKFLMFAGVVGALALSTIVPAKADPYVDTPSLGRIVYGVTGGSVVLPSDAWTGSVPGVSGTTAVPNDWSYSQLQDLVNHPEYAGDDSLPAASKYAWYDTGTSSLVYSAAADHTADGTLGVTAGITASDVTKALTFPAGDVLAIKLAYVSDYGTKEGIWVHDSSYHQLLAAGTIATASGSVASVGDLWSLYCGATSLVSVDSAILDAGYNHFKAYYVGSGPNTGHYYVGVEDWPNDGSTRWDWNDTVLDITIQTVPEPAFYQMGGLLGLGALGLFRLRRRSA